MTMSDTKTPASLPRLLSDDAIAKVMADQFKTQRDHVVACGAARSVRNIYEADRQKTREVVQALVNSAKMAREAIRVISPIPDDGQRIGAIDAYTGLAAALSSAKSQLNIEPTKP